MALFLKGTLFSVSHLQRKLHKKWISYNGYHPCTHTKGKNIKNETFYQISQEKIPNHQSLVCMFLIVCMFFVFFGLQQESIRTVV
mmetsp:Transcript_16033/g.27606  ORF Transcript_16033/g.27606 Transcript_16033/m.27606 type:complete len:85 (+) Transcript_16033:233-487(+)